MPVVPKDLSVVPDAELAVLEKQLAVDFLAVREARGGSTAPPKKPPARPSLAAMGGRIPARMQPRADLVPLGDGTMTISTPWGVPIEGGLEGVSRVFADEMLRRGVSETPHRLATFRLGIPEGRMLSRADSPGELMRKIGEWRSAPALVAAGGLCAPVAGFYDQLVLSEAHRPVAAALPTFGAARGGIRYNPPPKLSQITQGVGLVSVALDASGQAFTDGATNSNTTVTSATAAFTAADVGRTISGTGIPAGAVITAVGSATSVTISQAATATATGVTITVGRGSKATFVATCPAIVEVDVQAIYTSLEFGNFSLRTFGEQVTAWTKLALAASARTADQALLDGIAANSTATTSAGLVGGGREVLARLGQAAAGMRSRHRMAPDAPLTCLIPQWVAGLMKADFARTFTDDPDLLGTTLAMIETMLAAHNIQPAWYADSKTGGGQVFGAQGTGVALNYPSLMYMYLFAPGTFLRLDAGTLDLGFVRDSVLNSRNAVRLFSESFENVAFVGVESLEIALTAYPDGSYGPALAVSRPLTT